MSNHAFDMYTIKSKQAMPGEYLYKPWAFDTNPIYLYMCVIVVSVNISE